jgi:carboxylesterase
VHIRTYRKQDGADTAVVFVHGFMGSPDQFADLADAVFRRGCSYLSVLLPGHGLGVNEFVKFGADDWERHLQSEIDSAKHDHQNIILVGHSMGGLLALNASLIKENNISGVVLISTPLKISLLSNRKLRLLLFSKSSEVKSAYMVSNSISKSKAFFYPLVLKPFIHLHRLIRKTKRRLPEVFVPVCMFHSKNDETTAYASAAMLDKGLRNARKDGFTLHKSWHAFYDVDEREIIKDKIIGFIQQIRGGMA